MGNKFSNVRCIDLRKVQLKNLHSLGLGRISREIDRMSIGDEGCRFFAKGEWPQLHSLEMRIYLGSEDKIILAKRDVFI